MSFSLQGKVALVTGGAVRLGRAIALALAEQGCDIAITYNSSAAPAEQTCADIASLGQTCMAFQADFNAWIDMAGLVSRIKRSLGHLDILVNSAAIFEPGYWNDTDEANWDRHFNINLKSPFFLSQAFAHAFEENQQGHIINIADWRGDRPSTDHFAYTLTKAGLLAMTKSLALALAPNIQVNAISPGLILPPPGGDESFLVKMAPRIPLKRSGSAEEITNTVLYLLRSDFITGETIQITGGDHL